MSWDWSEVERAWSHHTKTNPSHPAAFPSLLSHWSVCFAFNVLVNTKGPLVIASAKEPKDKKTCNRVVITKLWDLNNWIWDGTSNQNRWIILSDCWCINTCLDHNFSYWEHFQQNISFPCRWNVWIFCHPDWWAQSGMQLRHSCH